MIRNHFTGLWFYGFVDKGIIVLKGWTIEQLPWIIHLFILYKPFSHESVFVHETVKDEKKKFKPLIFFTLAVNRRKRDNLPIAYVGTQDPNMLFKGIFKKKKSYLSKYYLRKNSKFINFTQRSTKKFQQLCKIQLNGEDELFYTPLPHSKLG